MGLDFPMFAFVLFYSMHFYNFVSAVRVLKILMALAFLNIESSYEIAHVRFRNSYIQKVVDWVDTRLRTREV